MRKYFLLAACILIALSFVLLPFPASELVKTQLREAAHPSAQAVFGSLALAVVFVLGVCLFYMRARKEVGK